jgi:hypothetical protein
MHPNEARFWAFHHDNPDVFETLKALARKAKHAGAGQYGIAALFEVLRWSRLMDGKRDGEEFKLNNNYKAFYARLLMAECPDLAGFFETREQVAA